MMITVRGTPAPQGSKRHVGGGRMVEMSKAVGPWREAVRAETQSAMNGHKPIEGPVKVAITFERARPRGHYGTGRNAHLLKDSAPMFPIVRPDIDKLARAVLDGITMGGALPDDSQVVYLKVLKLYGQPGCTIEISELWRADR
jgi:Holliday junction resolvase RusA-like endonuclease